MAIPKVKITFDADLDGLRKGVNGASNEVEGFGDKVAKFGKMAAAAFAAAAAAAATYAIKIGVDGVKAALDDEKAQRILAKTLENTTGATVAQVSAVEDYITKTSLAIGVTDDKLRPAFSRLVRSTKDTEEAQKLLNLALDISSATGKPLEGIANSLGKAYDGNTNALGRLGLGIDQSVLKTKDFNLVYENLRSSFAGFAANEANTFQGRLDRMKVAFDEAKETIGFALLPILEKLMSFINRIAQPILDTLNAGFDGKNGLGYYISNVATTIQSIFVPIWNGLVSAFNTVRSKIEENKETFLTFGNLIATYIAPLLGNVLGNALSIAGKVAGGVIDVVAGVIKVLNNLIQGAVNGINALITAYNSIRFLPDIPKITAPTFSAPSLASTGGSSASAGGIFGGTGGGTGGSTGGSSSIPSIGSSSIPDIAGDLNFSYRELEAMGATGFGLSAEQMARNISGTQLRPAPVVNNNISIGIAGDPENTARTIVDLLNRSQARGTLGAGALVAP